MMRYGVGSVQVEAGTPDTRVHGRRLELRHTSGAGQSSSKLQQAGRPAQRTMHTNPCSSALLKSAGTHLPIARQLASQASKVNMLLIQAVIRERCVRGGVRGESGESGSGGARRASGAAASDCARGESSGAIQAHVPVGAMQRREMSARVRMVWRAAFSGGRSVPRRIDHLDGRGPRELRRLILDSTPGLDSAFPRSAHHRCCNDSPPWVQRVFVPGSRPHRPLEALENAPISANGGNPVVTEGGPERA